ncbi:MAG TPA: hypothetical protein VF241_07780 [Propionibacteriaceae bacterium]
MDIGQAPFARLINSDLADAYDGAALLPIEHPVLRCTATSFSDGGL